MRIAHLTGKKKKIKFDDTRFWQRGRRQILRHFRVGNIFVTILWAHGGEILSAKCTYSQIPFLGIC